MEGADVYQIAKNCRTSVKMIEEFYASHIKNMVDASATMCDVPGSRMVEAQGKTEPKQRLIRWKRNATWPNLLESLHNPSWYAGVAKLVDART
jgi:hypothetical protein